MNMRLSICIPTRNRAAALEESLSSLTRTATFLAHTDIEIVISDNASTDPTAEVVDRFVAAHGDRIRYFRNEVDVSADRNFEIVMGRGRGAFLKLSNDYLAWTEEGLAHMYELVGACERLKPIVFFLNGARPTPEPVMVLNTADEFLATISHQITWIGSFGLWREHFEQLSDFSRCASQQLVQVDVLCRMATLGRPFVVSNIQFARTMEVGRKGGYSLAKVFGANYASILASFAGTFSPELLAREKRSVLLEHILPWHFSQSHDFGKFPLEEHLDPVYGDEPYYRGALVAARAAAGPQPAAASAVATPTDPQQVPQAWRLRNAHNETYMVRLFDIDRVSVGQASYGPLDVRGWGHPDERLAIGHFVSISEGVTFVLGGNHPYRGFSTYPFKVKLQGQPREAQTKGAITVGDDVWIGTNAMIMSGVSIGQGAIVGAGAVVASDVPPYAIVAGNPARVLRYRFGPAVIAKLMTVDFGRLQPQALAAHVDRMYEALDEGNVDELLECLTGVPA